MWTWLVERLSDAVVMRTVISALVVLVAVLVWLWSSRRVGRRLVEVEARYRARKAAVYLCGLFAVVALVGVWFPYLGQLGWALGLVGAGLALALAGPIGCLAGWLYLVVRRPFDVGDRVQVGAVAGDVIDIQMIHTTLMEVGGWVRGDQSTGRMVLVPNQRLFTEPVHNYTKGFPFVWNELTIVVTFESDWRRARDLMLEHAQGEAGRIAPVVRRMLERISRRYALRYGELTPIVYARIAESGVELTLRHLVETRQRRGRAAALAEAILDDVAGEPTVAFAYPTQRITGLDQARQVPGPLTSGHPAPFSRPADESPGSGEARP